MLTQSCEAPPSHLYTRESGTNTHGRILFQETVGMLWKLQRRGANTEHQNLETKDRCLQASQDVMWWYLSCRVLTGVASSVNNQATYMCHVLAPSSFQTNSPTFLENCGNKAITPHSRSYWQTSTMFSAPVSLSMQRGLKGTRANLCGV